MAGDRGTLQGPTQVTGGPSPWPYVGPNKVRLGLPTPSSQAERAEVPPLRDRRPSAPLGPLSAGVGAASTRSAWVSLEITLKTYNLENTSIHFRLIATVTPEYECYHHVTSLRRLNNFPEAVDLDGHGGRELGLLTTAILCLLFPASDMGSVACLPHRLPFLLVVPDFEGGGRAWV